jgi:hypothetical protein
MQTYSIAYTNSIGSIKGLGIGEVGRFCSDVRVGSGVGYSQS